MRLSPLASLAVTLTFTIAGLSVALPAGAQTPPKKAGNAPAASGASAGTAVLRVKAPKDSMLRIVCDSSAKKAEVTVDGEFKGECSVDVPVAAGTLRIRVVNKSDPSREQVFEEEVRMGAGTVKRIDVEWANPFAAVPLAGSQPSALQLKAATGDAPSMLTLSGYYENGTGGHQKDPALALDWMRKAAAANYPPAMTDIGFFYQAGMLGLAKDQSLALTWYRKAAALGNASAMANIGVFYRDGAGGLQKNDAEALVWLRKASALGNQKADELIIRLQTNNTP